VERHLKYKEVKSINFYENIVRSKLVELVIDWCQIVVSTKVKKRGKAIPVQAWIGAEGSRSLRLPDFMTFGT
jgi:hypothetical protein